MGIFSFKGKSGRAEWWATQISSELLSFGVLVAALTHSQHRILLYAAIIFISFALWASLAVSVRRMRDRNRHPLLLLLALIPYLGWIWFVIECGILPRADRMKNPKTVRRQISNQNTGPNVSG